MRPTALAALAVAAASACQGRDISRIPSGGGSTGSSTAGASSGGSSTSSATSAGTTQGSSASSSGATGTGTSGGGGTTGESSSTTGTTGWPPSPYWDGGYVFCSQASAADAGPNGDGGPASWLCTPGTYFCDTSGNLGNCFQCLSDADCANQALPTYDPQRPRCDLDSGVVGYQNRCQVCLTSADCTRNPAGPFCNLQVNTTFPDTIEPPIEDLGFETCGPILEDCRVDGGPACNGTDQYCDPANGRCEGRGTCTTDQDCAGVVGFDNPNLLEPFCVEGYCGPCDGGNCPYECTSDADCGGFWPACVKGLCSCAAKAQCGDAGLLCFLQPSNEFGSQLPFCGLPCTAAGFPSCSLTDSEGDYPICNPAKGQCEPCASDQQCQSGIDTQGPHCLSNGACGCTQDSDCPSGQACQPSGNHEICVPRPNGCSIQSCWGFWCDWDSGECTSSYAGQPGQLCHDDYDCSHGDFGEDYCDPKTGSCVACRNDADCEHQDGGVIGGHNCIAGDAGPAGCGCTSDEGCAGIVAGSRCQTDAGLADFSACGCVTAADCPAGLACISSGQFTACTPYCLADFDCQTGFFCDPYHTCRARCDPGNSCQAPDLLCDTNNDTGESSEGRTYCFQCLQNGDCPQGQSCLQPSYSCGICDQSGDCPTGETCTPEHTCEPICVNAADCPGDEGCNSATHTCGSCRLPVAVSAPNLSDCPPDDICSDYWSLLGLAGGVCLPNCDRTSCPADKPICAVLPALTPDHSYCFGCLTDADCADSGPGAWCDVSVGMTFSCQK